MDSRNLKRPLTFLSLTLFFGCGVLLTHKLMKVRSVWDYVVIHMLTLMSGLGLIIVVVWWLMHIRRRQDEAREALSPEGSRGTPDE